jgi:hypothetical protein
MTTTAKAYAAVGSSSQALPLAATQAALTNTFPLLAPAISSSPTAIPQSLPVRPLPVVHPVLQRAREILRRIGRPQAEGDLTGGLAAESADWTEYRGRATQSFLDN